MAANDDFPHGPTREVIASGGGLASLTIPAIPRVTHVIDSIVYRFFALAAGIAVNVGAGWDPGGGYVELTQLMIGAAAGSVDSDVLDRQMSGFHESAVVVRFNNSTAAGQLEIVRVTWHDI